MNGNQPPFHPAIPPSLGKNDEIVRGLCAERELQLLDALPTLLRYDSPDDLWRDALEAAENYDRARAAIVAAMLEEENTSEELATLIVHEYLARKSFRAYQAELELRAREAAFGLY